MRTKRFQQVAWMVLLGLVVSGLVWSTLALAQTKKQGMSACIADEQKLCPDAKTAKERAQCLKSHEADLSQACKDMQAKAQAKAAGAQEKATQVKDACKAEVDTYCKDLKAGSGLAQCLKAHEADLSGACKAALPKGKGKTS